MDKTQESVMASFNRGDEVDSVENGGGAGYETILVKITHASIVAGDNNHENPLLHNPQKIYLKLDLTTQDKRTFSAYQSLTVNLDGAVVNYAFPEFVGKDGNLVPESISHEVLRRAKEHDPKQDMEGIPFGPNKFVGLKFPMEIKEIERKDGETAIIAKFAYQAMKDDKFREEQAGSNSTSDNTAEVEDAFGIPSKKTPAAKPAAADNEVDIDDLPF